MAFSALLAVIRTFWNTPREPLSVELDDEALVASVPGSLLLKFAKAAAIESARGKPHLFAAAAGDGDSRPRRRHRRYQPGTCWSPTEIGRCSSPGRSHWRAYHR